MKDCLKANHAWFINIPPPVADETRRQGCWATESKFQFTSSINSLVAGEYLKHNEPLVL